MPEPVKRSKAEQRKDEIWAEMPREPFGEMGPDEEMLAAMRKVNEILADAEELDPSQLRAMRPSKAP